MRYPATALLQSTAGCTDCVPPPGGPGEWLAAFLPLLAVPAVGLLFGLGLAVAVPRETGSRGWAVRYAGYLLAGLVALLALFVPGTLGTALLAMAASYATLLVAGTRRLVTTPARGLAAALALPAGYWVGAAVLTGAPALPTAPWGLPILLLPALCYPLGLALGRGHSGWRWVLVVAGAMLLAVAVPTADLVPFQGGPAFVGLYALPVVTVAELVVGLPLVVVGADASRGAAA